MDSFNYFIDIRMYIIQNVAGNKIYGRVVEYVQSKRIYENTLNITTGLHNLH